MSIMACNYLFVNSLWCTTVYFMLNFISSCVDRCKQLIYLFKELFKQPDGELEFNSDWADEQTSHSRQLSSNCSSCLIEFYSCLYEHNFIN